MAKLIHDPAELYYQIIVCTVVAVIAITCLFPLVFVVGMSFTGEQEMIQKYYFVVVPERPTLSAYQFIFRQQTFLNSMMISVMRTVLTTVLTVIFVLLASYVLAETKLPGRKAMLLFIIITMLIGGGLIPTYLLLAQLKLLNTFLVMVIPGLSYTYGILVVKTFIEEIPQEINDSVEMDGAGDMYRLVKIIAPLTTPCLAAIALFTAVGQWNSWFDALVYLRDTKLYPVSLVIRNLLAASSQQTVAMGQQSILNRMAPETLKMASVVVAMVPILCVYPFLQKYFIHGVFKGAVKG